MNRALLWGLIATTAVSAWAVFTRPRDNGAIVLSAAIQSASGVEMRQASHSATLLTTSTLRSQWPAPAMEIATRSPFESPARALPRAPVQKLSASAPTHPDPPSPPSYRFWGRLTAPDQRATMYLVKGESGTPTEVKQGTSLEDGWIVDSISDNTIVLANAATQQRTTIFVPPAEAAATR